MKPHPNSLLILFLIPMDTLLIIFIPIENDYNQIFWNPIELI